jgi:hypothetical protein
LLSPLRANQAEQESVSHSRSIALPQKSTKSKLSL